ncbi:MAG: Gfo/Idh/MocA family oxidoreductase, partial [Chloroflexi bacterium]|nr:Gfo/Idh/MocA family oxidoreductase [Chloroflexota bacterium]
TYFTWRWIPHFRYLQSLIGEDYIGRVFHCHLTQTGGYGRDGRYAWRFDGRRANGILGDLGSHMIDLARWLVGEIGEVSAQLATLVERAAPRAELVEAPWMPANDSALLGLRFASGAQGMIHVNAVQHRGAQGQKQTATFDGALGTLEASYGSATGSEIHGIRHDEDHFTHLPVPERFLPASRQHPYDVFRTEAAGDRLFIDAILEDRAISPSFYDGWKAQQVIEAALLSDREGRRVHIAEHQA